MKAKILDIQRFLNKISVEYGFYITKELRTYMDAKAKYGLTAEQVSSMILADKGMDILLSYDLKKQIEEEFKDYFDSDFFKN